METLPTHGGHVVPVLAAVHHAHFHQQIIQLKVLFLRQLPAQTNSFTLILFLALITLSGHILGV